MHAIRTLSYPAPTLPPGRVLGSTAPDAITLGRYVYSDGAIGNKIRYGGPLHVLVFGPNNRAGKTTRILLTNIFQMSGCSLFIVDVKGELCACSLPYRRSLGKTVVINPFRVLTDVYPDMASTGYNPLLALDPASPSFDVDASLLAEAIVGIQSKEPHWDESARVLVAIFIMYVVIEARASGGTPTFARVRELLCEWSVAPDASNNFEGVGIPKRALEMMKSNIPGLRNKAAQFTDWNREIQGIASTARRQTESFDDPEISADLSKANEFNFRDLKRANEPVTTYLILPPDMMERHGKKWLRLLLTSAIHATLRVRQPGEPKVVFMIDEFFALGRLEIIETVWALSRSYGVQIIALLQDHNQLTKLYPDMHETFLGNCGASLWFGPNSFGTAEWMSRRAGETTREAPSVNYSESVTTGTSGGVTDNPRSSSSNSGWSTSTSFSTNTSFAPVKVPLISAHQVHGLQAGYLMIALNGLQNVVPAYAPAYYQIAECVGRARANPYYLG